MAVWESFKNFIGFENSDYEEEEETNSQEETTAYEAPAPRKESRILGSDKKNKSNAGTTSQMQVIIVKPDHFEDVTMIANHINAKRSVVLNLEASNRETSRRIIDFISGVTYANHGTVKKVAGSTFMITPDGIDIAGEELIEEYDY